MVIIKITGRGVRYITQLAGSVPTTANFHFYEKLVKEYAQKRKAIQIAGKIMEQAQESESVRPYMMRFTNYWRWRRIKPMRIMGTLYIR
jgi:replicative DNA helicase